MKSTKGTKNCNLRGTTRAATHSTREVSFTQRKARQSKLRSARDVFRVLGFLRALRGNSFLLCLHAAERSRIEDPRLRRRLERKR